MYILLTLKNCVAIRKARWVHDKPEIRWYYNECGIFVFVFGRRMINVENDILLVIEEINVSMNENVVWVQALTSETITEILSWLYDHTKLNDFQFKNN